MKKIKNIFWNDRENRIRSLWRIVCQFLIVIPVALLLQYLIIAVIAIMVLTTQSIQVEQIEISTLKTVFRTFSAKYGDIPTHLHVFFSYLGGTWLAGRIFDRRRFVDFGLHFNKQWWLDLGFGLLLGAFLMTVIFLIELVAGWVAITGTFITLTSGNGFHPAIIYPIVIFILVGIQEELVGRGYQLTNLAEGLNWKHIDPRFALVIASVVSAAIFGLTHSTNPHASAISTFNVFLGGIFLAVGFILTGELAIPIGLHIAWNFFQGNVFGFPVSGTAVRAATFISVNQGGPSLWTGGAFGPEAGLLGVGAMVIGCLLILGRVKLRDGRIALHTEIAEAPSKLSEDCELNGRDIDFISVPANN